MASHDNRNFLSVNMKMMHPGLGLRVDDASSSTKDSILNMEQKYRHILNFKDFKKLKKIENIKDRYRIGRVLGEGSFGQVRIAEHRAAGIKCAIKLIPK